MKKLVLCAALLLCCISVAVHAQEDKSVGKGNWLIGESMNISHQWGAGTSFTYFMLNSDVGYFVNNYIMPEASITLAIADGANQEFFQGGARFYYNKSNAFLPYARMLIGIGSSSIDGIGRDTSFVMTPGLGFDYLITKNVAIGIQANYSYIFSSPGWSTFSFPVGFSLYF